MNDILQEAIESADRDVYETVTFDRARHTLEYLRDITSSDPAAGEEPVSALIATLEGLDRKAEGGGHG